MNKVFIIVPSASFDSPVKGACALANGLLNFSSITFVTLKGNSDAFSLLNKRVEILDLGQYKNWYQKLRVFKKILIKNGTSKNITTISIGFSADLVNSMCCNLSLTCSSVRGDLPKVYKEKFGRIGKLIAYFHLKRLRKFNHVISMTKSMSLSIESYIGKKSPVIGNFIDEIPLERYRRKNQLKKTYKFIYTGSLIKGKQPFLLISAIKELLDMEIDVELDILGDGPLLKTLKLEASKLPKSSCVSFYGYLEKPYKKLSEADVLVMPSLTEGVSRSVLEALYLGIPCVLRDIEGSSEIILSGVNGEFFHNNKDLSKAMLRAALLSRSELRNRNILTLSDYRQELAINKYIKLLRLE